MFYENFRLKSFCILTPRLKFSTNVKVYVTILENFMTCNIAHVGLIFMFTTPNAVKEEKWSSTGDNDQNSPLA